MSQTEQGPSQPGQACRDEVNSERCSAEAGPEHRRSTRPRRPPLRYGWECIDQSRTT